MATDFFSIAETTAKYSAMPIMAIRPICQSKKKIITANTAVVSRPLRMFTSTMPSMPPTTVVHTPATCPRLLALKKPMGTLFRRSAMATRRSAAMK